MQAPLIKSFQAALLLLAALLFSDPSAPLRAAENQDLKAFTGSRTRIAWAQDQGKGDDPQAEGSNLILMGLDTDAGGQERPILSKTSNYYRPLITPSGSQVVFTNLIVRKVYVVNWDGSGLTEITRGVAEAVWRNPADGVEWVYVRNGPLNKHSRMPSGETVDRFQINHPEIKSVVWDNRGSPLEDFQLSADGTRASGSFPWPIGGVADLTERKVTKLRDGCWASMSPDNSYRSWVFDGSHRFVWIYQPDVKKGWRVNLNEPPELRKHEVYHPRWSNHPRFIGLTGPYGKRIDRGGADVEIYLEKFSEDYHEIEQWVQVTHNDRGDFFPDVWIESASHLSDGKTASSSPSPQPATSHPAGTAEAPAKNTGLVFSWENSGTQGQVAGPEANKLVPVLAVPRGMAIYGRNREMVLPGAGSFVMNDTDDALLKALAESSELSIEAVIIPSQSDQRGPAEIITFSSTPKSRNFSLAQDGSQLTFRVRTDQTGPNVTKPVLKLCKLTAGEPNHVVVTFEAGRVVCFLNGKQVADEAGPPGDFSTWSDQHLVFGDEWRPGTATWTGTLEGVAIYKRALSAKEAAAHADRFLTSFKERVPVERVVVRARLLSATPPPSPESIAPYRRALLVNEYEVLEVVSGSLTDKKLQAVTWGILDAKVLPQDWKVGAMYELMLEKFSDQPQLEGERVVSDSSNFDLNLYYATDVKKLADAPPEKH